LPKIDTEVDPVAGLLKLLIAETEGAKKVTSTREENADATEMAIWASGKNTFDATLHKTALAEFHELTKGAVRPTREEAEGPVAPKLWPITVTEREPDIATAECAARATNGEFQDKPALIDLIDNAIDTIVMDAKPWPTATLPCTALLERQEEDVAEVNPTRTECDDPEEEKPPPKTVILVLPLEGKLVIAIEDTAPGIAIEMLNDPNPTRDALTSKWRTFPIPETILNIKELSEIQIDLSDEDPCNFNLGEANVPKNLPNTEMLVLPDDGIELAFLTLEMSGPLKEHAWVMTLVRSCKLAKSETRDTLPLTDFTNKEESLCQVVWEVEVSEIRTLKERDVPVFNNEPRMYAEVPPVVGKFVELTLAGAPRSNVNEFVNVDTFSWALTAVNRLNLEPWGTFGTTELVDIHELDSSPENPNTTCAL
jgi:hypothetical protein